MELSTQPGVCPTASGQAGAVDRYSYRPGQLRRPPPGSTVVPPVGSCRTVHGVLACVPEPAASRARQVERAGPVTRPSGDAGRIKIWARAPRGARGRRRPEQLRGALPAGVAEVAGRVFGAIHLRHALFDRRRRDQPSGPGRRSGRLDRSSRHIDRNALRSLCATIPAGTWTTYGDVAGAIGVPDAAQSVAGVLATDHSIPNAHRVLRSTGRISPGFTTADGGRPDIARSRLEEEGVPFGANGAADPGCRWSVPPPS